VEWKNTSLNVAYHASPFHAFSQDGLAITLILILTSFTLSLPTFLTSLFPYALPSLYLLSPLCSLTHPILSQLSQLPSTLSAASIPRSRGPFLKSTVSYLASRYFIPLLRGLLYRFLCPCSDLIGRTSFLVGRLMARFPIPILHSPHRTPVSPGVQPPTKPLSPETRCVCLG